MLLMANPWKEPFESTSIQFFLFDFDNLHVYQQNSLENMLLPWRPLPKSQTQSILWNRIHWKGNLFHSAKLILIIKLQDVCYLPSISMDWDFCSRCHVRSSFITIALLLRAGWRASSSWKRIKLQKHIMNFGHVTF